MPDDLRERLARIFQFYSNNAISDEFGTQRLNSAGQPASHTGNDYAYPAGTPIPNLYLGNVVAAGSDGKYGDLGNYVAVKSKLPDGSEITTLYGHLSEINVAIGDPVNFATILGKVGSTGYSSGPHLHLETRYQNQPFNPNQILGKLNTLNIIGGNPVTLGDITKLPGDIIGTTKDGINTVVDGVTSGFKGLDKLINLGVDILEFVTTSRNWWGLFFIGSGFVVILSGFGLYFRDETAQVTGQILKGATTKGAL